MKDENYPRLFQDADSLAVATEKKYYWLVRSKIALLITSAVMASFTLESQSNFGVMATVGLSLVLVVSMGLTAYTRIKNYDQVWSNSRVVAESVKAETWVYVARSGSYGGKAESDKSEELFLTRLREILQKHPSLYPHLASDLEKGAQITDYMGQMRSQDIGARATYYVGQRIHDQRLWYMKKAKWNRDQGSLWFAIGWALEICAIGFSIVLIGQRNAGINPIGIVGAAGAGALSWIGSRSYNEASESYGFIAQELLLNEEKAKHLSKQEDLDKMTADVEGVISKEHMVWLARLY